MSTISVNPIINTSNSSSENDRDWLELPWDVTLLIMIKLGTFGVLKYAQFVCKLWYKLCNDPSIWRTVQIIAGEDWVFVNCGRMLIPVVTIAGQPWIVVNYRHMLFTAVARSVGTLVDLNIENLSLSDDLLYYIASRSKLKRLRLARCDNISSDAVKELSSLEELEITLCPSWKIQFFSCPSLTTLRFNNYATRCPWSACDDVAFCIAGSMPELRHLQLIGNNMTDVGLKAILDGCPHLQSLDLRACFQLELRDNLKQRLSQQIKYFRHPNDSTDDYDYDAIYEMHESEDEDPYTDYEFDTCDFY